MSKILSLDPSASRQLQPLVSPWPFAQWGIDLVSLLPKVTRNRRWLIVATDYFTKWVEAEPFANIKDKDSIKFVWKNIITRFGMPKTIISDNETQFNSKPFMKYCLELGIRNIYNLPAYLQSNGQAEASNKTILDGIKKRLEDAKGRWVEELPNVLWTFRTTLWRSTRETPFSLAYSSEAVVPLEIGLRTLRTSEWEPTRNDLAQSQALDLLEERKEQAMIRLASYQQQLKKGYNKNVRPRTFQQGDLVLRKVLGSTKNLNDGKLGPNWERPYRVQSVTGIGAYHLEDLNSVPLPWPSVTLENIFISLLFFLPFFSENQKKKEKKKEKKNGGYIWMVQRYRLSSIPQIVNKNAYEWWLDLL